MKKNFNISLIVLLSSFTLIHFLILSLHAGPINPVYAKHRVAIEQYATPLLTQNWNLFAPDPVEETQNILIRYKVEDGGVSDWYNVSAPLLEANRSNIVSPYNRAARIPSGLYFGIFKQDELVAQVEESTSEEDFENTIDMERIEESRLKQVELLYRFANSTVPLLTTEEVGEVQVKILNVKAVPFSERDNPDYETEKEEIEFDWKPYEPVRPIS